MTRVETVPPQTLQRILDAVRHYWGFGTLRPLQEEAILAGLDGRDSLVVMPTGGGKSLCYQVPPLLANRTDVVVSPLIALMKDQSDGLRRCGYPAAALHSNMTLPELRAAEEQAAAGAVRLLFVAPERLVTPRFMSFLDRLDVRAFAIDEAHCISHWGHDFRPDYRQLAVLKQRFPGASLHAYTATATPRVREDIVEQLRLTNPSVLVGIFDRPNLAYRVVPRIDVYAQTLEAVRRHAGQAVIVYCLSRRDTEEMAAWLTDNRIRAAHYHAGMDADYRRRTQDAFAEDKIDVIVATVAFGMGIDRGDVRCVIHASLPKSVEHYQQETGRAGRDGLEAECTLFYSAGDVMRWERLIDKSAEEAANPAEVSKAARRLLRQMQSYANAARCRHRAISEHFGQSYERNNCGACDICLEEMEVVPDSTVTAQKILSCVARVQERFGAVHVIDVLRGGHTEKILQCGHDRLSTHGLLKDLDKPTLMNLVHQIVDLGLLERTPGEMPVLKLNLASWEVMRGWQQVRLLRPATAAPKRAKSDVESWEGVDSDLFESLRGLRRELAEKERVPAYLIFGDATLRDLARLRPTKRDRFARIRGVGQQKLLDYGAVFTEHIQAYCRDHRLTVDLEDDGPAPRVLHRRLSAARRKAFELFARQASVEEVMKTLDRAHSTTLQYLAEYIAAECPEKIDCWVAPETYRLVAEAARRLGTVPLKPIFEALNERIPYDTIRLVARHLEAVGAEVAADESTPPGRQPQREPRTAPARRSARSAQLSATFPESGCAAATSPARAIGVGPGNDEAGPAKSAPMPKRSEGAVQRASKRIVVLANSIKRSARCVAGIEVETGAKLARTGWIRPVSSESGGELEPRHMRVDGGSPVAVLDIVDVPVTQYAKDATHPEDWIVDLSRKWTRIGALDPKTLGTLEEKPQNLWLESTAHTDRVKGAFLTRQSNHQSLYLVRPTDFRVELSYEHNSIKDLDQKKTRAKFTYSEHEYRLSITDPVFTDRHCTTYPALDEKAAIVRPPYGDKCLLCVSLTPEFNGYHYKVVAAVLELS